MNRDLDEIAIELGLLTYLELTDDDDFFEECISLQAELLNNLELPQTDSNLENVKRLFSDQLSATEFVDQAQPFPEDQSEKAFLEALHDGPGDFLAPYYTDDCALLNVPTHQYNIKLVHLYHAKEISFRQLREKLSCDSTFLGEYGVKHLNEPICSRGSLRKRSKNRQD